MRKGNLVSEFLWHPQTISSGRRGCEEQRGNIEAGVGVSNCSRNLLKTFSVGDENKLPEELMETGINGSEGEMP